MTNNTAAHDLANAVELACKRGITDAITATETAHDQLRDAIRDAYSNGIASHTVADWLGWSRSTYYRYLFVNAISDPV